MEELFREGAELDVFELLGKIWEANSSTTLIFLVLAMATWLIGVNVLVVLHYRRVGKPAWSVFTSFGPPIKDFNGKEWTWLAVLASIALTLGALALASN